MPPLSESPVTSKRILYRVVVFLLFALALIRFFKERRGLFPYNDLTTSWVATRVFLHGKNPYGDIQEFNRIWASTRIPLPAPCADYGCMLATSSHSVYPPTTLALIAPLGLFRWHVATYVYASTSVALFILALLLLARKLSLPWNDLRTLYFVAFALAMQPLHKGIYNANLNTLVLAFLCAGVGLMPDRPYGSGIAIAIAVCLKPQVGIFFFLYPWLRKKWKTALVSLATCTLVSACSVIWLRIHHVEWLGAFLRQVSQFSAPGGFNSAEASGPWKFMMVNLQVLTFQFTHNRERSGIFAGVVFGLLACASVYLIHRRVSDQNESAGVAIVAVLTLLAVYQRFYTAEILLFVLYWAVENCDLRRAKVALWLMVPLLVPFVQWAATTGIAVRLMGENHSGVLILWNNFLMPQVIWIELLLLLILMADLSMQGRTFPRRQVPA